MYLPLRFLRDTIQTSYYEPIRLHQFSPNSKALTIVRDRKTLKALAQMHFLDVIPFGKWTSVWEIARRVMLFFLRT